MKAVHTPMVGVDLCLLVNAFCDSRSPGGAESGPRQGHLTPLHAQSPLEGRRIRQKVFNCPLF